MTTFTDYTHPDFVGAEMRSEDYDFECGDLLLSHFTPQATVGFGSSVLPTFTNTADKYDPEHRLVIAAPYTINGNTYRDIYNKHGVYQRTQVTQDA